MRLSQSVKRRIRDVIGKCEICGTTEGLEVHHIDGNPENNVESNLIVLCREHHIGRGAQYGHFSKTELRKLVRSRNETIRKEIRNILRNAKKERKRKEDVPLEIKPIRDAIRGKKVKWI